MREEFQAYGLSVGTMRVVGLLKVGAALALLVGLWWTPEILPAALLICVLMLSALAMHIKIKDPLIKSMPALFVLVLSLALAGISVSH